MSSHRDFEKQLNNFRKEVSVISSYLYADFSINHAASKSKKILNRLNETPLFWNTVSAALQTAAYIALGRVFDQHKESRYTIDKLLCSAESNIASFQREALAGRKRHDSQNPNPSWLKQYLDEAYYPSQKDFNKLKKKVVHHRAIYIKAIKPARNKYIAHREKTEANDVSALFGRGKVKDLYQLSMFLHQLHGILWQLFYNGKRPVFNRRRYSINAIFRDADGSAAHEYIVKETKQFMQFLEGSKAKKTF